MAHELGEICSRRSLISTLSSSPQSALITWKYNHSLLSPGKLTPGGSDTNKPQRRRISQAPRMSEPTRGLEDTQAVET